MCSKIIKIEVSINHVLIMILTKMMFCRMTTQINLTDLKTILSKIEHIIIIFGLSAIE